MEIHHSLTFWFLILMIVMIVIIVIIVIIVNIVNIENIVMIVMEIHCSLTFCIRFFLLLRNIRPTCNTSQNDLILIRILTNKQNDPFCISFQNYWIALFTDLCQKIKTNTNQWLQDQLIDVISAPTTSTSSYLSVMEPPQSSLLSKICFSFTDRSSDCVIVNQWQGFTSQQPGLGFVIIASIASINHAFPISCPPSFPHHRWSPTSAEQQTTKILLWALGVLAFQQPKKGGLKKRRTMKKRGQLCWIEFTGLSQM